LSKTGGFMGEPRFVLILRMNDTKYFMNKQENSVWFHGKKYLAFSFLF